MNCTWQVSPCVALLRQLNEDHTNKKEKDCVSRKGGSVSVEDIISAAVKSDLSTPHPGLLLDDRRLVASGRGAGRGEMATPCLAHLHRRVIHHTTTI